MLITARAAISDLCTRAATARSETRIVGRGSMHLPFRKMKETFPNSLFGATRGSGDRMESPRVRIPEFSKFFARRRCANSRRSLSISTMSPSESNAGSTRAIMRISPGQSVGTILHPVTCNLRFPDERSTSPASSHLRECVSSRIGNIGSKAFRLLARPRDVLRFCTSCGCRVPVHR